MALTDSKLVQRIDKVIAELKTAKSESEVSSIVEKYLETSGNESTKILDFDSNLEWLNCKDSLSFKSQLRNKICVLDFFTYCCINCMHILPDLEFLEHKYSEEDGVVVVGVHSAKFENEKSSANILSAIIRYGIGHAVVNDSEAKMWHSLGVACWPTLVVVGPSGEILLSLVGEGHRKILVQFVGAALKYYKAKGQIRNHKIGIQLAKDNFPKTSLSFPGKVCTDKTGKRLVVSDTGHHRILVMSSGGVTQHVIGGTKSGFKDGSFSDALFHSPQGVTMKDEVIFVADTENHAVRKIDFEKGTVTTVAGTGHQGNDKEGGGKGQQQSISSPWDVAIGPSPGSKGEENNESVLYIAMAGTHQLWALYLTDASWLKGGSQKGGTCIRFAGSGDEANRNNSYPHKAAFAQPSGLALACVKSSWTLFVADSESSSIRMVDIATGATKAVVGADKDPNNLFAFGDVDGKGVDVKLQHPLGVAWNQHAQELFVADSYNHKIKKVTPSDKSCTSIYGSGKPDRSSLDEPGGICVSPCGQRLYVADTNNSFIRSIDLTDLKVTEVAVLDLESRTNSLKKPKEQTDSGVVAHRIPKRITSSRTPVTQHDNVNVTAHEGLEVTLNIKLPEGCKLNEEAPSKWQVCWVETGQDGPQTLRNQSCFTTPSGVFKKDSLKATTRVTWPDPGLKLVTLQVEAVLYYCVESSRTCHMGGLVYHVPLVTGNGPGQKTLVLNHTLIK